MAKGTILEVECCGGPLDGQRMVVMDDGKPFRYKYEPVPGQSRWIKYRATDRTIQTPHGPRRECVYLEGD